MSRIEKEGLDHVIRWIPIVFPVLALGGAMVWFIERDSPSDLDSSPLGVESESPRAKTSRVKEPGTRRPNAVRVEDATEVSRSQEGILSLPGALELESRLHQDGADAGQDVELIIELLKLYSLAYKGSLPLAPSNEVLIDQLKGNNPVKVSVLSPNAKNISARGELLDRWAVPYFFHSVSDRTIEVRSAGPDRIMWTEDDIQLP